MSPLNLSVFGASNPVFADGWTRERVVAAVGGSQLDLRKSTPGDGAVLSIVAILGGVDVIVPRGMRVSMSGARFLAGQDDQSEPGDGPQIHIRYSGMLSGLSVHVDDDE